MSIACPGCRGSGGGCDECEGTGLWCVKADLVVDGQNIAHDLGNGVCVIGPLEGVEQGMAAVQWLMDWNGCRASHNNFRRNGGALRRRIPARPGKAPAGLGIPETGVRDA